MTDTTEDYTMDPLPKQEGRKPIGSLPRSSDDRFWTPDAERNQVDVDKLIKPDMSQHYLEWRGPYAVCTKCPYQHAIPLDFRKYDLINGQPVKKPIDKGK